MIRVILPYHLQNLANTSREVVLTVEAPVTILAAIDVLEQRYPMLRGTIRDQLTLQRRPYIRFFACGEDWSHQPVDRLLPENILNGKEPLRVVGAMAGG